MSKFTIKASPEWRGHGEPPIGAKCLMKSPILGMWANKWLEVEIVAIKDNLAIGWCESKQIAIWSGSLACRPLSQLNDLARTSVNKQAPGDQRTPKNTSIP